MKLKTFVVGGAAVFFLAACAAESDPVKEQGKFLIPSDKAVDVEFTDPEQAQAVVGFRSATVIAGTKSSEPGNASRSQQATLDRVKADCTIKGDGYGATFVSPSFVNMPSFGPDTKPVTLSCTYEGKTTSKEIAPVNLSAASRDGNALVVGIVLCPICGLAVAAGNKSDKVGDAYGFELMELELD